MLKGQAQCIKLYGNPYSDAYQSLSSICKCAFSRGNMILHGLVQKHTRTRPNIN